MGLTFTRNRGKSELRVHLESKRKQAQLCEVGHSDDSRKLGITFLILSFHGL